MYVAMCCVKQLEIKTKFFIHADIVVLVSEFVMVFIWVVVSADHCGHIPGLPV